MSSFCCFFYYNLILVKIIPTYLILAKKTLILFDFYIKQWHNIEVK